MILAYKLLRVDHSHDCATQKMDLRVVGIELE